MMVICVSNTADRFHGFLRSVMINPHPGTYVSRDLDKGVQERLWAILSEWYECDARGMVVMIRLDKSKSMGLDILSLGSPKREIVELEGHYALVRDSNVKTDENESKKYFV